MPIKTRGSRSIKETEKQKEREKGIKGGGEEGRGNTEEQQSILFHYDYPRQLLRVMAKVRHLNVISCRRQGAYLGGTAAVIYMAQLQFNFVSRPL